MAMQWRAVREGKWSGRSYWSPGSGIEARIDAYLVWADATAFADIRRNVDEIDWVPLLIELKPGKTASDFADAVSAPAFKEWVRVPDVYGDRRVGELAEARYCTASVKKEFFARLHRPPLKEYLERFELGLPAAAPLDGEKPAPDSHTALDRPVVVVGTIDDNFAFAHANFREAGATTTRIDSLWMQDGTRDPASGFGYGREISGGDINHWLREATLAGNVDEDDAYRRADYAGATKRLAHGTHVLDLSAGVRPADVSEAAPRLVCVQFPDRKSVV